MPESIAVLETTQGNIHIRLMPDVAPKTCINFTGLIERGYYDGVVFHRIIPNFMIQGGDPTGTGTGGDSLWGGRFADECDADVQFDRRGLVAMANAGPNTNGSQFFITTRATPWLNMNHTIFGEVIEGYGALQKLEKIDTDSSDRPQAVQKIHRARLQEV